MTTRKQRRDAAYNAKTGSWILLRRRAMELSQKDLAELLEVTPQTVGRWERGVTAISSFWVGRLKDLLRDQKKAVNE